MSPSPTCEQFMESPRDLAEYFYCHTHFTGRVATTPEETFLILTLGRFLLSVGGFWDPESWGLSVV